MIYLATQEEIQAYQDSPNINQSSLKTLLGNVIFFSPNRKEEDDVYYEEKRHFIIGTGVDIIITQENGEFNKKYFTTSLTKKPTEDLMKILHLTYSKVSDSDKVSDTLESHKQALWEAIDEIGWYNNRRKDFENDNRPELVLKDQVNKDYWKAIVKAGSRIIISNEEFFLIKKIVNSIITHPNTSKYFLMAKNSRRYDIVFQFPIYFNYRDVDCKGLLDMVFIDHEEKTIIPIDIKTIGDFTFNFPQQAKKRRYDIQAAFYNKGLKNHPNNILRLLTRVGISGNEVENYKILPFRFIVESTINPGNPLMYWSNPSFLVRGEIGISGKFDYHGNRILGFHQAIEYYKYYMEHGFDIDIHERQNNGLMELNIVD